MVLNLLRFKNQLNYNHFSHYFRDVGLEIEGLVVKGRCHECRQQLRVLVNALSLFLMARKVVGGIKETASSEELPRR